MNVDTWRYCHYYSPTLCQTFKTKPPQNQCFSLPAPIITHISTKSSVIFEKNSYKPSALQYFGLPKLLKTCKYFLFKFKIIPIKTCSIEDESLVLGGYDSNATHKFSAKEFLSRIINSNFRICFSEALFLLSERLSTTILSTIMEKTAFLAIRKLQLRGQNFIFAEFSFLISSPVLFDVTIDETTIWLNDKTILPVENIIEKLPNVGRFDYIERGQSCATAFSPHTLQQISLLKRKQKFHRFWLSLIPPQKDVDIKELMNFITLTSFPEYSENTFTFKFNNKVDEHSKLFLREEFLQLTAVLKNVCVNVL